MVQMSPATIDRRLRGAKVLAGFRGASHTKPGALLKSQVPIRTWSEWDEGRPGFVEVDLVGHEGGNSFGEFCFTLTVTDVATGWTVNRSVKNKAAVWVAQAMEHVRRVFPFDIEGVDSDNGSEFINAHFFEWCHRQPDHLHPSAVETGPVRRYDRAVPLGPAGNVAAHPGGVAQLVERLTGSQEVRGFKSHRLHSRTVVTKPDSIGPSSKQYRPGPRRRHPPGLTSVQSAH